MAVPRLLSRGRCFFPLATPSTRVAPSLIPSIRTSISKRGFTASQCSREDIVQTPSRGPEVALTDARARSTSAGSSSEAVMMMVPKRWAKTDIEQILRSKGCTIKRLLMRVDRFTFMNAIMCFIELGSEAEATKAIKELNGFEAQGKSLIVKPLNADFSWEKTEQRKDGAFGSRYFIDEGTAAYDAMRPLLERRRIVLSVETPGWSTNKRFAVAIQNTETIIERQFGKYGIESVSGMSRFDKGKTDEPSMLCLIDFTTKEGAENAVNNHHDTQIEGRLTWLRHAQPSAWRIHQIQKVVGPEALKALQESGAVPEGQEVYEDKFVNPRPKRREKR